MSRIYIYPTRIIPALSVIAIVVLLVFAFVIAPHGKTVRGQDHGEATISQLILSVYTTILHLISINFAARVCWAMGDIIKNMKAAASIVDTPKGPKNLVIKNEHGKTSYPMPLFVIIMPAYKEEMETLQETSRVLASHSQARRSYHVRVRCIL